ncbi:serine hydrolase [Lewinella sp. W8]|uniref:serine hydrolase n=1 Tax=Lewinella sp. W8 TaxID=2528208 RepID=UPI0010684299|nr:serine hydrolase [Lewinella sp. W8]MTB52456.1 serine hydrolase [Lewinella sp. W8]
MRLTSTVTLLVLLSSLSSTPLWSNNGKVAFAFPIKNITVDGRMDDWPAGLKKYAINGYRYGARADHPDDANAFFMAGHNLAENAIYVFVSVRDDDYVRTPDDDHYASHDLQVLYLDVKHDPAGSGVLAYELTEDHRKIVHQEDMPWYPELARANWDNVTVKILREGGTTNYEWKIVLPDTLEVPRALGFDYVIFDKDESQNSVSLEWGPGGEKFSNNDRLGDLVLVREGTLLSEVTGRIEKVGMAKEGMPERVELTHRGKHPFRLTARTDSLGNYALTVPVMSYEVSIRPQYHWNNWFDLDRMVGGNPVNIRVRDVEKNVATPLMVAVEPQPAPPEKGVLHEKFTKGTAQRVDEYIRTYMDYYNIPGVSVGLIQDGKLVYHRTYGVENAMTGKPVRMESVFEAASITKSVFAYVMNRLTQRGDFDLDRPLHEQFPFPELEKYPEYKKMTARHVLTHVSGLPNWGAKLLHPPGTQFGYSGEGFEYLKKVVAGGVGPHLPDSIQRLLDQELLEPLGMTNTYFKDDPQLRERGVSGHYDGRPTRQSYDAWPGMAFSMHTNAQDFAPFALALLERKGLTEAQAEAMFTMQTLEKEENFLNGYPTGFGLGIALRESPYGMVFGHGGNNGDFRCQFEVYDDLKMGYIIFTNSSTGGPLVFDFHKFAVEGSGGDGE